jgi:hypothetical protein
MNGDLRRSNTMQEIVAVVENGQIRLPPGVHLPEGVTVRVILEDEESAVNPYDRDELTEEHVRAELDWAMGKHLPR